ncbi:hypothetical protein FQN49_004866 [Arthroderma sp. PD_2]|nr:hypothetical protein FQN49_004866 [Arthroderma sp. PD_2]
MHKADAGPSFDGSVFPPSVVDVSAYVSPRGTCRVDIKSPAEAILWTSAIVDVKVDVTPTGEVTIKTPSTTMFLDLPLTGGHGLLNQKPRLYMESPSRNKKFIERIRSSFYNFFKPNCQVCGAQIGFKLPALSDKTMKFLMTSMTVLTLICIATLPPMFAWAAYFGRI